jgi:hypothetical protein
MGTFRIYGFLVVASLFVLSCSVPASDNNDRGEVDVDILEPV